MAFCDTDITNIKNSKFCEENLIVCGSKNILINWTKQFKQIDTAGKYNVFYINSKKPMVSQKGVITIDRAKEKI